jgi:hypothetical protein
MKRLKLQRQTIRTLARTSIRRVHGANRHEDDPTGTGAYGEPEAPGDGGGNHSDNCTSCCDLPPTDSCTTLQARTTVTRNIC